MAKQNLENNESGFTFRSKLNSNFTELYDLYDLYGKVDVNSTISGTYQQLKTLKDNNELIAGTQYLLTDYITKYRMPYVNIIKETPLDGGAKERLVLTAVSENTFSLIASSLDYPKDIIYYDFDDNICEDGVTPRNGFIQRRVDTIHKIDIPQDWRTMVWARLKATALKWTSGNNVARGSYKQDGNNLYLVKRAGTPASATDENFFQFLCTVNDYFWTGGKSPNGLTYNTVDFAERYTFNADTNLTKKSPTKSNTIIPENIVIAGAGKKINTEADGLSNNVFCFSDEEKKPKSIQAAIGFYSNTFGDSCYGNTFGVNCYDNTFGENCYRSTFGSHCDRNMIMANCKFLTFGSYCYNNTLGSDSPGLLLTNACFSNTFGANSSYTTLENYNHNNTFGTGCSRNTLLGCDNSIFGNDFKNNTIYAGIKNKNISGVAELHGKDYIHEIFINSAGAIVARHYNASNAAVFTSIT